MRVPRVSVLLPIFNGEKYMRKSISNILNQTFENFELIIIDDASTDKTKKYLKKLNDKRVKIITNKVNLGVTESLNIGLKAAKGEYIARCDADDFNLPKRFKKQVDFLDNNPDYLLVGSKARWINEFGKKVKGFNIKEKDAQIRTWMFIRNQFHHASVMFRKDMIKKIGGYRPLLNGVEDYDLWFRVLKKGKVYNLQDTLIKRTINPNGISIKKHLKVELLGVLIRSIHLSAFFFKI